MKKIVLLIIMLFLTFQTIKAQTVVLDSNGVTVKWTGTTVPSPYLVQANPRGPMEWFAIVNNSTKSNITNYANNVQSGITYFTPPGQSIPIPFNNIVTTLVTNMANIFLNATAFNQPIESWDVSNVINMNAMFRSATAFNQPIESWDVSSVTKMVNIFRSATVFNQPIGSWNVSSVTNLTSMFQGSSAFNQNIGSWNVSNVTNMSAMFRSATAFNQPIDSWDVSSVTNMSAMFIGVTLSTANYDALLIGWSTISPNESPLQPNVTFSGGNSNYCNGATARASIISTYGWTITDAGLNCSSLDTEIFDTIGLKLYPNPVLNVLNVTIDYNRINQPYTIVDGLGRVVLKGNLNDVDTTINVEQLSKGIYYIKLSYNTASKFIKE